MAHELRPPQHPVAAARLLVQGNARLVRPGEINGHLFLLMAGFGYDGEAVRRVSPWLKARMGKGAYAWAGLSTLVAHLPNIRAEVSRCAGEPASELPAAAGIWLVVSRSGYYGGPFKIHPVARVEAPELGVTGISRRSLLPFIIANLGLGLRRSWPGTWFDSITELRVKAPISLQVQVDGDYFGNGREFRVGVSNSVLPLVFPTGS